MEDDISEKIFQIQSSYDAQNLGEETFEEGVIVYTGIYDGFQIETVLNEKEPEKYFKFIRSKSIKEFGKVCRIKFNAPEYFYNESDVILTLDERKRLVSILNSKTSRGNTYWESLIYFENLTYAFLNQKPIDENLIMPDYNLLVTVEDK